MRRAAAALPALALVLANAGCVTGSYARASIDEPVLLPRLEALQPGRDDLGTCLAALGAPQRVFEYQVAADHTSGAALLWYWRDASGFGVDVSSGTRDVPGSLQLDYLGTDLPGCMLWFGPDLVLERWQLGQVGDLLPTRVRPGAPPDA